MAAVHCSRGPGRDQRHRGADGCVAPAGADAGGAGLEIAACDAGLAGAWGCIGTARPAARCGGGSSLATGAVRFGSARGRYNLSVCPWGEGRAENRRGLDRGWVGCAGCVLWLFCSACWPCWASTLEACALAGLGRAGRGPLGACGQGVPALSWGAGRSRVCAVGVLQRSQGRRPWDVTAEGFATLWMRNR